MAEYIKKSAAICVAEKYGCDNGSSLGIHSGLADCIASEIDALPAADVAPVLHGSWLNFYGDFSTAECDICAEIYEVSPDESPRKEFFDEFKEIYKFCPNCGAKMDGGDKKDE